YNNEPAESAVNDYFQVDNTVGAVQVDLTRTDGTGIAQHMAANNYTNVNLVLYASTETNDCTYRHFKLNPTMTINYTSKPGTPSTQYMKIKNGNDLTPCSLTSPGPFVKAAISNAVYLTDDIS